MRRWLRRCRETLTKATGALIAVALTGAPLALGGCDPAYGVIREADLDAPVALICIRHAIETTQGVTEVTPRTEEKGHGLFHPEPTVHSFLFAGAPGSDIRGAVQICEDYRGNYSYHDTQLYMGLHLEPDAVKAIEATRPVMREIEKNIAAQCGVPKLPTEVREDCLRYTCKPLGAD